MRADPHIHPESVKTSLSRRAALTGMAVTLLTPSQVMAAQVGHPFPHPLFVRYEKAVHALNSKEDLQDGDPLWGEYLEALDALLTSTPRDPVEALILIAALLRISIDEDGELDMAWRSLDAEAWVAALERFAVEVARHG